MTDTFLSPSEVAELTGIKTGRNVNGQTIHREQLQAEQLRQAGVPFVLNARGRPIVVRAALTGSRPRDAVNEAKPRWQSNAAKRRA